MQIPNDFPAALFNKVGPESRTTADISDDVSEEYLLKSALLMDELAKRVSADNMSHTINKFAENIFIYEKKIIFENLRIKL